MESLLFFILVFAIGFLGALIGAVAAGAGLITVPGLILLGVPPHISLASARLAGLGFRLGALVNYLRHKKIIWNLVLPLSIIGIAGGTIGAQFLIEFNTEILEKVIGIILLALMPILFLRKGVGTVQKTLTRTRRWLSHGLYFIVKTWGGFFSPGNGFMTNYIGLNAYGLTILRWKGTTRIPEFLSDLAAVVVFSIATIIDYKIGVIMFIAMFSGSFVGSHIAIKKGDTWIKPLIAVFIILASVKLILF